MPNNHPRDPTGIPGFHPRIHLSNDGGLISEKQRGFFAKWRGNFSRELFFNG
jgi:hypothetical protein